MKKFLLYLSLVLFTSAVLTLCKKSPGERMTAEDLKIKYGLVFSDLQYESDEPATAQPDSRGQKKKAAATVTVHVLENALPVALTDTTMVSEAPANTEWFGGQKFPDTTSNNNVADVWGCQRWFSAPGTAPTPISCKLVGTGFYRVYSRNYANQVLLSRFLFNP